MVMPGLLQVYLVRAVGVDGHILGFDGVATAELAVFACGALASFLRCWTKDFIGLKGFVFTHNAECAPSKRIGLVF